MPQRARILRCSPAKRKTLPLSHRHLIPNTQAQRPTPTPTENHQHQHQKTKFNAVTICCSCLRSCRGPCVLGDLEQAPRQHATTAHTYPKSPARRRCFFAGHEEAQDDRRGPSRSCVATPWFGRADVMLERDLRVGRPHYAPFDGHPLARSRTRRNLREGRSHYAPFDWHPIARSSSRPQRLCRSSSTPEHLQQD